MIAVEISIKEKFNSLGPTNKKTSRALRSSKGPSKQKSKLFLKNRKNNAHEIASRV
jgi:hypothetical protein